MTFFWILWGFDGLTSLIVLYFLMVGLMDGSITSRNAMLWLLTVLAIAGIMGGSLLLKSVNQLVLAKILLCIMAIPAFLYGLFIFATIVTKAKWN